MDKKILSVMVGFSEVDITPESIAECELVGFYRPENNAKGILDKLKAQVLLIQSDNNKYCLIAIDSIGFTIELTNCLREDVAKKISTKRENVMICFSHTHSAPNAAANELEYFKFVYSKILEAVKVCSQDLFPVKACWGIAENNIGVNRRGRFEVIDNQIGILKLSDAVTNENKITIIRVGVHANILTSDNFLISSDFFGTARTKIENKYGCKTMLIQGASGNIKPKYRQSNADYLEIHAVEAAKNIVDDKLAEELYNQSLESLQKTALELLSSLDKVFEELKPMPIFKLNMFSVFQTFYADVPTLENAKRIADEAKRMAGMDGTEWLEEVARLNLSNIKKQKTDKEIQFFCINDGCFCGIADEPMCEIALDIQKKSDKGVIFFNGYTNGYEGYLASAEEYDRGGYEVLWSNLQYFKYYNRVMPLNRESAELLAGYIADIWNQYMETKKT